MDNSFRNHQRLLTCGLLFAILTLGAWLRFYRLGEAGVGNTYYAAAVKSMLVSWQNFFFLAFEPGGSVSLDKPPLGFWLQALATYFLGVSGFSLALPNASAGVLSLFLIYQLVRRPFGEWIGLLAALALAVTPVAVSVERNNTVDGLLACILLLAAWGIFQAIETGRLRWLLLGAFIVGLGFNIKMLQAILPLPAFYAAYFCGTRHSRGTKILHLAVATGLLIVVSLSWAMIVDLTPTAARPYIDSTGSNSVMELIIGHNGLERLMYGAQLVANVQPVGLDFGVPGPLRLFSAPLAGEIAWLLPFALGGLLLLIIQSWQQSSGEKLTALLLWTTWLLPVAIYFSWSTGRLHPHYLVMISAPLAALAAITIWGLWKLIGQRSRFGWALLSGLAVFTLVFQGTTIWRETARAIWALIVAGFLIVCGLFLAAKARQRESLKRTAFALICIALFIAPATWSVLTTLNPAPDSVLPYAGPTRTTPMDDNSTAKATYSQDLLSYLLENTAPETYLFATGGIGRAADYILQTGRPVLPIGGFLGQYEVVTVPHLAKLIETGQLRFVLGEELEQQPAIAEWLRKNCTVVDAQVFTNPLPKLKKESSLYDCAK